jgi:hypothetical protein
MTQNDCAVTLDEVDIASAFDIKNMCAFASSNDVWLAAYRLKCTY